MPFSSFLLPKDEKKDAAYLIINTIELTHHRQKIQDNHH